MVICYLYIRGLGKWQPAGRCWCLNVNNFVLLDQWRHNQLKMKPLNHLDYDKVIWMLNFTILLWIQYSINLKGFVDIFISLKFSSNCINTVEAVYTLIIVSGVCLQLSVWRNQAPRTFWPCVSRASRDRGRGHEGLRWVAVPLAPLMMSDVLQLETLTAPKALNH